MSLIGQLGAAGAPPVGGYYPHAFVMASGRVLVAGPDRLTPGCSTGRASTSAWTDVADLARDRQWGTAVLLPGGPSGPRGPCCSAGPGPM